MFLLLLLMRKSSQPFVSRLSRMCFPAFAYVLKKVAEGEDLENVFENVDMSQLAAARGFEAMKTVKTKKKKEKRNKWMPFRRPDEEAPKVSTPAPKSSTQSKKSKNKSFLESSDEDNDPDNNLIENDENV